LFGEILAASFKNDSAFSNLDFSVVSSFTLKEDKTVT
jgi:hypothetical protein